MLEALSTIVWDVDPVLVEIGPLTFRYYGILFATALMGAYTVLRWQFEEYGEDPEDAVKLTYALVLGVVLGSRLGHVFFYEPERYWNACFNPVEAGMTTSDCLLWLKFWKGGLASHGATLGIIVVLLVYTLKIRKVPFRLMGDRFCMGVCCAVIFIRLGNLFNSEIVGRTTDAPWGVLFPQSVSARPDVNFGPVVLTEARHPSQLYEALIGILIFAVLLLVDRYYKKKGTVVSEATEQGQGEKKEKKTEGLKPGKTREQDRPLGLVTFIFFAGYFGLRFFAEFYKEYQTDVVDQWTMGQWLSIPFTLAGLIGIWAIYKGPWKGQVAVDYLTPPPEPEEKKTGKSASSSNKAKKKASSSSGGSASKGSSKTSETSKSSDEDSGSDKPSSETSEGGGGGGGGPKRKLAKKKKKSKNKKKR